MSGIALQGSNSKETRKLGLCDYKVSLLKTITTEGVHVIDVEPWVPVFFLFESASNLNNNRIGFIFHSGSSFLRKNEARVFGLITANVGVIHQSSQVAAQDSLILIPTEEQIEFEINTAKFGIGNSLPGSGSSLHVFQ